MLYEIHMLKNYPPTNLNRDDTGAPKTCLFGGAMRGRISSQCLKRSWRTSPSFRVEIGDDNLGIRTRKLPVLVAEKLVEMGVSQEFADAVFTCGVRKQNYQNYRVCGMDFSDSLLCIWDGENSVGHSSFNFCFVDVS